MSLAWYTRVMVADLLDKGYCTQTIVPLNRWGEPEPYHRAEQRARSRVQNAARRAGVKITTKKARNSDAPYAFIVGTVVE